MRPHCDFEYPALIDGEPGAYGVVFPDLPGCVAMGATPDEALRNAAEALRDWIDSMEAHAQSVSFPSYPHSIATPPGSPSRSSPHPSHPPSLHPPPQPPSRRR